MNESESEFDVIANIISTYPESEWLKQCQKALPEVGKGFIMSYIEILSGGDIKAID